jgi:hypothetical protein
MFVRSTAAIALYGVLLLPCDRGRDSNSDVAPSAHVIATPPPSALGCANDTDCKGDRVCDRGACVARSPKKGAVATAEALIPEPLLRPSARPSAVPTAPVEKRITLTCPGGEVPVDVSSGCMCRDNQIQNPCTAYRPSHHLEGRTCVFECEPATPATRAAQAKECQPCVGKGRDGAPCAMQIGNALPYGCCESDAEQKRAFAGGTCP